MARAHLEVQGLRTLRRTLKQSAGDLEQLKKAHAEVARIVADRAADRAPARTGRLRETIRASGTNSAAIVRAGRSAVPYAGPIHWGWPARHIKAQPFIYTAANETQPAWEIAYLAHLEHIIAQIEGAPGP